MSEERRRARTLDELIAKMARVRCPEGQAAALAFVPRPSDVIITPWSKCGTTWLQQIVHSLRTGGDLDFDDICRVVPWIELAYDMELDLEAEQRAEPRAFKSHLPWDDVPKGARYIVSTRDPRDAMVSGYKFHEGWTFDPGAIGIEEFCRYVYFEGRGYYKHLVSWWPRRDDPSVLLLAYEHMLADRETAVRRIADFMGVTDERRIAIACEQSSFAAMKANHALYDDPLMRQLTEDRCPLPPGSDSSKVREGGSHRAELSQELLDGVDVVWQETVKAATGLPNYEALLAELAG